MKCVCCKRILAQARKKYGKPQYPERTATVKKREKYDCGKSAETVSEVWEHVQQAVRELVTPISYETWIEPCRLLKLEGNQVVLAVDNNLHIDMLQKRFLHLLEVEFTRVMVRDMEIELVVHEEYR